MLLIERTDYKKPIPVLNLKELLAKLYEKQRNLAEITVYGVRHEEGIVDELGYSVYLADWLFDYVFYLKVQKSPFFFRYYFDGTDKEQKVKYAFCFQGITGMLPHRYKSLIVDNVLLSCEDLWNKANDYELFVKNFREFIDHMRQGATKGYPNPDKYSLLDYDYLAISFEDGEVVFWELPVINKANYSLIMQETASYVDFFVGLGEADTLQAFRDVKLRTWDEIIAPKTKQYKKKEKKSHK